MKLIGYVRVSTDMQAEEGVSLEAQEVDIRRYCELYKARYQLLDVVRDEGWSGSTLQRPGIQAVLQRIQEGQADGVIVSKLDRLSRSVLDLVSITEQEVSILSVNEQIDTSTPTGRLIFHMLGAMAQWERETIAERVRRALLHLRERGVRLGEVPYGLTLTSDRDAEGRLIAVKNEDEQAVIRLILALRQDPTRRLSYRKIAEYLNQKEIPTKKGNRWFAHSVWTIAMRIDPALVGTRASRKASLPELEAPYDLHQ